MSLATSALAEAGVRPVWTDFQPAVSTQSRPPDGGWRYPKLNTNTLIRPSDRRAAERNEAELNRRAANPVSTRGSGAPALPPASPTTDPLLLPPDSGPALPSTAPSIEGPRR